MFSRKLVQKFLKKTDPNNIRRNKPQKPIFIEIGGTPNSGKTSVMETTKYLLKANGMKVGLFSEWAHYNEEGRETVMYEINKGIDAMKNILDNVNNKNYDIFLLDRGLYDVYCWINWRKNCTEETLEQGFPEMVKQFFTCSLWCDSIDIAIFLLCEGKEASQRDRASKLLNRNNKQKKEKFLCELNTTFIKGCEELKEMGKPIITIDTTYLTLKETEKKVIKVITDLLKNVCKG
jgi:thymidylate kinase